jgi:hypothetical protein
VTSKVSRVKIINLAFIDYLIALNIVRGYLKITIY